MKLLVPTYVVLLRPPAQRLTLRQTMRVSLAQLFACIDTRYYIVHHGLFGSTPRLTAPVPRKVSDILMRVSRAGFSNHLARQFTPDDHEIEKLLR